MKTKQDYLDSKEFYDVMQCYRVANMMDQENVIKRFEAVKNFIRKESAAPELLKACQLAMQSDIDGSFVAASKWWNIMKLAIQKATS